MFRFSSLLSLLLGAAPLAVHSAYTLQDDYSPSNFFSMFNFYTGADPTNGVVQYVDQATAESQGLISTKSGSVVIGVDSTNVVSGGRPSVRLESKSFYNTGLWILDLAHMPASVCGSWPAFWSFGSKNTWPADGEIDIIENVHTATTNQLTLHTSEGCKVSGQGQTATQNTFDCYVNAAGQSNNAGCGATSNTANSFGDGVDGVYATEWTDEAIKIWYFPRANIPGDISSGSPDPTTWGTPQVNYDNSQCDIPSHFKDHQIIFDITFCGDWAGNTWSSVSECSAKASTCDDYVRNNPTAFANSYWEVNSLKAYTAGTAKSKRDHAHHHARSHLHGRREPRGPIGRR